MLFSTLLLMITFISLKKAKAHEICKKRSFSKQILNSYSINAFEISKKSHPQVFSLSLVSFEKAQFTK